MLGGSEVGGCVSRYDATEACLMSADTVFTGTLWLVRFDFQASLLKAGTRTIMCSRKPAKVNQGAATYIGIVWGRTGCATMLNIFARILLMPTLWRGVRGATACKKALSIRRQTRCRHTIART